MEGMVADRNRDENNNLPSESDTDQEENKIEIEEEVSKCSHSKFCFSRDVSEKEEALLRPHAAENITGFCLTNAKRISCKKCVTFDRSAPKLITRYNDDSEIDVRRYKAVGGVHFDTSDSESVSTSESEVFGISSGRTDHSEVISKSEEKLCKVLEQLQQLWLDLNDGDSQTSVVNLGNKNLSQTVSLIELITDNLVTQYRKQVLATSDPDRLSKLQCKNDVLEEELQNARNKIHCLEAEMSYFSKENALLNKEVKEIAFKMASSGYRVGNSEKTDGKQSPEAEIFYQNPHQHCFDSSDSKSSAIVDPSRSFQYYSSGCNNKCPKNFETVSGNGGESHTEFLLLKRENEMNTLLRDYEKFNINNCSLHAQFQIYDEHLENWKRMLNTTNDEKQQMLQDLVKVVHEHKAVLKERDHYEFVLKLLIEEKGNIDFDMKSLLQNLVIRLQEPSDDSGSWIQTSLLEGAVQSLQQQNGIQREEIYRLKYLLSESEMRTQVQANELDDCSKKIAQFLDELNSNDAKLRIMQEEAQIKCDKVQDLCNDAVAAKTALEKKLSESEEKCKELQELLHGMKKTNRRHHKKSQQLQKNNLLLVQEIKDSKGNMDHLSTIISQLRSSLKDQKSEWNEKLRSSNGESCQNKQHCEWLKCQMDQINLQLKDALDRLKMHEMDKVQLAQQLLLAEEERRVVDRKLQELRTALQGDTGLREALIERNEALQMEINRLRLAKANPLKESSPPMEMSANNDLLLSAGLLPPTETYHGDKYSIKKNCYTANYRRTNDVPRTAVSLHNGGAK